MTAETNYGGTVTNVKRKIYVIKYSQLLGIFGSSY